ncbi:peptide-methionine (S)-S-oxide reductase MsrA [Paenibacillus glycinis]|uniref:Peptide methionine sulfoxide reductase MsrA n=1 Tax=Paenibacillus glycinis TaxID=2697035 RepID=A0ABW9XQV8_9BACL|nr:peptide-methionine (S)-S-oxide reductase MsrA [Paenibacillus glycinis]NBD25000.1 peptide-methionine (S)-S-oxide reductase MsrA [Paenibacillus glycinis]
MNDDNISTVTLGMGCFWSPDALFGQMRGIIRTRVGYAGGTLDHPTYRQLGDHTETVELDFDPRILSLEKVLDVFWRNHNPFNINDYKGRQYQSLVLYRDLDQQSVIQNVKNMQEEHGNRKLDTEIAPFNRFYLAEDRHQKYYLKRYPNAIDELSNLYPSPQELTDATLAARLNGLAKGYVNLQAILDEIRAWPIDEEEKGNMLQIIQRIRW